MVSEKDDRGFIIDESVDDRRKSRRPAAVLDEAMALIAVNEPAEAVIEWCVCAIIGCRRRPNLIEA